MGKIGKLYIFNQKGSSILGIQIPALVGKALLICLKEKGQIKSKFESAYYFDIKTGTAHWLIDGWVEEIS